MLDDCKHTARCQSAFGGDIRGNCDSNAARWINGVGKASQGTLTKYGAGLQHQGHQAGVAAFGASSSALMLSANASTRNGR